MHLTSSVFATANNHMKIIDPLLSRFVVLQIEEYKFDEFVQITLTNLSNEKVSPKLAKMIAHKVWFELGSRDIRNAIKIGRLANNEEEISQIISMMKKCLTIQNRLNLQ